MIAPRRGAAAVLLLLASCASSGPAEPVEPLQRGKVTITTAAGQVHTVSVEIARTPAQRARGLMFRTRLERDAGMIFLFEASEPHGFWMKNTLIPLDLVYLSEDGHILAIVEKAEPGSLTARDGGVDSRYVLEVNGGWCKASGVGVGDRARFEGVLF
ncbi:MAG: DUF192 domain-containing protein [Anaeromyxobacter sp.]